MTTRSATREERQLTLLWLAAAVSAVALRPVWLKVAPLLGPCVFRSLTGIPCPTCGSTRAITAFLHGDLVGAITANPLVASAGLLFIVGAPLAALWTTARWPLPVLTSPLPRWARWSAVAMVAVNWFYLITSA